jgi:signal transduction histidine kinase
VANERRRIVATVVAVLLVTAALVGALRAAERRDASERLEATAEALAGAIGRELDRTAELGTALSVSLRRLDVTDTAGYERLLEEFEVGERYPSVLGVSWILAVPREELAGLVLRMQETDPAFEVRTDAGGDELRLILQVHPRARNAPALGVDVVGRPASFDASERARASGAPALSDLTQLVQLPPDQAGAVLYVPQVGDDGDGGDDGDDGDVQRWLGLTFAGDVFLGQLQPLPPDVGLRVVDPDSATFPELGQLGPVAQEPRAVEPLVRFGQRWLVEVTAGPSFLAPWSRRGSTLAGIGGVVVAVLLSALVRSLSTRERRARSIADHRTRQLAAANADLAELNAALQDANAGKDAFLASVSHELRTPLTVIGGFTDSMRRIRDGDGLEAFLDPIDRNVRRLDGLVSDLLTLASLDAGAVAVFAEDVDLSALARAAPRELAGLGIAEVDVQVPDAPVLVRADRRHLERILTNLLTNAARHGAPPIQLRVEADGEHVLLAVRDHGVGVDPALQPELFQRFVRGPRTTRVAGTGLGLAIVRELAHLNGGSVEYRAAEPGACFEVRLPTSPPQSSVDLTVPEVGAVPDER